MWASPSGSTTVCDIGKAGERSAHPLGVQAINRGTGDERNARRRKRFDELRRSPQQIRADQDVVGTARQADRHALHRDDCTSRV